MATAKRKTSAKRSSKPTTKSRKATSRAATSAARKTASKQGQWTGSKVNDWQKGANEWAKQSAKLYQLPFANAQVGEATKQAAAQVQSATESFVRAGNDIMSQMFGGTDPMAQWSGIFGQSGNPQAATEKLRSFGRDSAEQLSKTTQGATRALNEAGELTRENAEAIAECSNIAIAVSKDIGAELISYGNRAFSQNVELSKQLLACRTLNDMFDLSSRFLKSNLDGFFSESVKLSEKLFQCANDVSEPLNARISESSERLSKVVAA